jgi:hypothetical protein
MTIRETILTMITEIAQKQKKTLRPLSDDLELLHSGMDSLCLAILVAGLDDELGLDPLSSADDDSFPVTIGDFIKLYENANAPVAG